MKNFNKKVVWNNTTESYELVSDSSWDIEDQISMYSTLMNKGFNDSSAASLVASISQTRPVYRCFCNTDHREMGYGFNPCPCIECEKLANIQGFDIAEPICHVSLSEAAVRLTTDFISDKLQALNQILEGSQVYVSDDDFNIFKSMLCKYGSSDLSWSQVFDSYQLEPDSQDYDQYVEDLTDRTRLLAIIYLLENFWLGFVVNNFSQKT